MFPVVTPTSRLYLHPWLKGSPPGGEVALFLYFCTVLERAEPTYISPAIPSRRRTYRQGTPEDHEKDHHKRGHGFIQGDAIRHRPSLHSSNAANLMFLSLAVVLPVSSLQYLPDDPLINIPTPGNLLGSAKVGTLIARLVGSPTKLDRVICIYSGVIRTHISLKQALAEAHGSDGPVQITYNNFLTLDVPAAHAVVAAVGLAPNANPNDGTDLSMPAQGVARTVDPNTGLRSS
ncbi:hypothetical protein BGY98DRAFT_933367 [Russula aff. rugulosa BPL654]|nr:hypothetical protein BGY98DRAFT_933367 [Russula aff. rugulosa BPL654]